MITTEARLPRASGTGDMTLSAVVSWYPYGRHSCPPLPIIPPFCFFQLRVTEWACMRFARATCIRYPGQTRRRVQMHAQPDSLSTLQKFSGERMTDSLQPLKRLSAQVAQRTPLYIK